MGICQEGELRKAPDLPVVSSRQKRCLVRAGIWSLIKLYQMLENVIRELPKPFKGGSFLPQRTVNHDPHSTPRVLLYPSGLLFLSRSCCVDT